MSDFKNAFRAAAAQRGGTAPSKHQIKALKAKRQALQGQPENTKAAVASASQPVADKSIAQQDQRAAPGPSHSKAIPADFFQEPASKASPKPSAVHACRGKPQHQVYQKQWPAPHLLHQQPPWPDLQDQLDPQQHFHKGFFADKAADAKARGEKIPDQKDKEEEFKQFQRLMDEQIKDIAAKEAEEAEEDAEYREEREAFEQRMRLKHLEELQQRKAAEAAAAVAGSSRKEDSEQPFSLTLPARKRRVIDVLQEQLVGGDSEEGTDEEEDLVLDWRAKGV